MDTKIAGYGPLRKVSECLCARPRIEAGLVRYRLCLKSCYLELVEKGVGIRQQFLIIMQQLFQQNARYKGRVQKSVPSILIVQAAHCLSIPHT